ncbi:MAG: molybdenum cofactor biosynthesis protein MoaE [Sphingomicrobium sp.]
MTNAIVRLEPACLDPALELDQLLRTVAGAGAIVSFVGLARALGKNGLPVERLVLEHHPQRTLHSLQTIAQDGADRFAVSHVRVVHRCGEVAPHAPIVFVAAASIHRREAFQAADYLMDRLKTDAEFWKREDHSDGSTWIEPTETDYADRNRWG